MKVLIVDDDYMIVDVIKDTVNWKDMKVDSVDTAYDVHTAKQMIQKEEMDIIISDIEMPQESGLDLLRWYREGGYKGKFLLLTCHEKFSYAAEALELQAADYILKPFNVEVMELVLKKNIELLEKERRLEQKAAYGQWVLDNMDEVKLTFFESLINGKIQNDKKTVKENIEIRKLDLNPEAQYRIIVSKVTNVENDYEQYGSGSVPFMLEKLHSEILCSMAENSGVILYDRKDSCIVITVCEQREEQNIFGQCEQLIKKCGAILDSVVTICISCLCGLENFKNTYQRILDIQKKNIIFYGQVFWEQDAGPDSEDEVYVLDMEMLNRFLDQHDQKKLLDYLKKELQAKIELKVMSQKMIKIIRQEFQQAVYAYLTRQGIQISRLLNDPVTMRMAEKAEQSVTDLLRWSNYLISGVFEYEKEIQKSQSLIEKVNLYIHEHYKENIGRNEIGAEFFIVPEYLARIYKKKTGKTLKDYINECRINQAKVLLQNMDLRIIDVAEQAGFDNVSYFSTLFKKSTGLTPNDYRKNL